MNWRQLLDRLFNEQFDEDEDEAAEESSPKRNLGKSIASSLLAIALIIAFLYLLQSILVPILFAILLATTFYPICNLLEKWGLGRAMASLVSLVFGILIFAGLGYVLVSQTINIGQDASEIVGKIETLLRNGETWAIEKFNLSRTEILGKAREQLESAAPSIGKFVSGFFGGIGNFLTMGLLVPLMIFFFLYYRDFFKEFFVKAFHSASRKDVENTLGKIYESLKSYLGGMLMVMGIIAALNTIGLMIMGIEYAWFFGCLASLLMLLPYIGIAIGSILPALFALATKDSYWYAIGVIGWFQVVQILEGNFITPNIVGSKISLNPLVSILSIFLFSMLFGFAGLILALPMMAVLKVIFDAVPELQPYGFLLSEPKKKFLWTDRQRRKKPAKIKREELKEEMEIKKQEEKSSEDSDK